MTYVRWPSANGAINQNVNRRHTCIFVDPKSSPRPLRGQESLTLSHTNHVFACLQYKSFEKIVGKGELASYEHFLFFPLVFSTISESFMPFLTNLKLSSSNSFSTEQSKVVCLGKGLNVDLEQNRTEHIFNQKNGLNT